MLQVCLFTCLNHHGTSRCTDSPIFAGHAVTVFCQTTAPVSVTPTMARRRRQRPYELDERNVRRLFQVFLYYNRNCARSVKFPQRPLPLPHPAMPGPSATYNPAFPIPSPFGSSYSVVGGSPYPNSERKYMGIHVIQSGAVGMKEDGFASWLWRPKWLCVEEQTLWIRKSKVSLICPLPLPPYRDPLGHHSIPFSLTLDKSRISRHPPPGFTNIERINLKPYCLLLETKDRRFHLSLKDGEELYGWQDGVYSRSPLMGVSNPTNFIHQVRVGFDPVIFTVRLLVFRSFGPIDSSTPGLQTWQKLTNSLLSPGRTTLKIRKRYSMRWDSRPTTAQPLLVHLQHFRVLAVLLSDFQRPKVQRSTLQRNLENLLDSQPQTRRVLYKIHYHLPTFAQEPENQSSGTFYRPLAEASWPEHRIGTSS